VVLKNAKYIAEAWGSIVSSLNEGDTVEAFNQFLGALLLVKDPDAGTKRSLEMTEAQYNELTKFMWQDFTPANRDEPPTTEYVGPDWLPDFEDLPVAP